MPDPEETTILEAPEELRLILPLLWSADTSSDPDGWVLKNSAWGQCAVTALLVQDLFQGELRRVVATLSGSGEKISHYYNRLENGILDLTRKQFPEGTTFSEPEARTRQYVLSYPQTMLRYARLLERYALLRLTAGVAAPNAPRAS